jgi:hypothetical protein
MKIKLSEHRKKDDRFIGQQNNKLTGYQSVIYSFFD